MRKSTRTPDLEAVARSLRELEKLFCKKPPDRNDNAQRELGADETLLTGKLKRGGVR